MAVMASVQGGGSPGEGVGGYHIIIVVVVIIIIVVIVAFILEMNK